MIRRGGGACFGVLAAACWCAALPPAALGQGEPALNGRANLGDDLSQVAVRDVNADGRRDLVGRRTGTMIVRLNTTPAGATAPSFAAPVDVGGPAASFVLVDVNADGRLDLATAGGTGVTVRLNTTAAGSATPSFGTPAAFNTGSVSGIDAPDMNGDGRPDLVTGDREDAFVLLNATAAGAATPAFTGPTGFVVSDNNGSMVTPDLNGDGRPDIAVSNLTGGGGFGSVGVRINTTPANSSTPSFGPAFDAATMDRPADLAADDLNADTKVDLTVTPLFSGLALVNRTTAGSSSLDLEKVSLDAGGSTVFTWTGDVDGDDRPDVLFSNSPQGVDEVPEESFLSILLNTTSTPGAVPTFRAPLKLHEDGTPTTLSIGDLTGDGLPDLALDGKRGLSVLWWTTENQQPPPPPTTAPTLQKRGSVAVVLRGGRLRLDTGLTAGCAGTGPECVGYVQIRDRFPRSGWVSRAHRAGRYPFRVPPGASSDLIVRLDRHRARALRRGGRVQVSIGVKVVRGNKVAFRRRAAGVSLR